MTIETKKLVISEELKRKIEMICKFAYVEYSFTNGYIINLKNTNIAYVKPHILKVKGNDYLIFEDSENVFINGYNNKIKFKDLEQYLKDLDVFVGSLEQGLAQYDGDYKKKQAEQYRPLDEENFTKYYDKLVNDLQKYEYNDLRELTNTLMYASKGEKRILFENVLKEIQNFQYEAALELLGKGQE